MPENVVWIPLVAALFSVFGIWLGARLTERRTYREKNWDRKALSYGEIFEAIGEMGLLLRQWLDRNLENRETDSATSDDEGVRYRAAKAKMLRTLWRESWSMPEAVVERIERLKTEIETRYDSWFEDLDASIYACRSATDDLRRLAREDMMRGQRAPVIAIFRSRLRGKK